MNWNTILLYAAIAFGGYLLGLLDRWVSDKLRKPRDEEPPLPAPAGPPDSARLGLAQDGIPYMELDGKRIDPGGLTPEQRSRLIAVLVLVRPWIDGPSVPPPARSGGPGPGQPAAPVIPVVPPESPTHLDLARGVRTFLEASVIRKEPEPQPTGIVGFIDAILQRRLAGTPLAGKSICLTAGPDGGVLVKVGPQSYSGVEAVPDPQIQAAIRDAIREWEKGGQ